MTQRRGNSDSKLSHLLRPKFDEENLDNFLPKFLIKDMNSKDEGKILKEEIEINEEERMATIFEPNEIDDVSEYLRNLSFKEVIIIFNFVYRISILKKYLEPKLKISRSKFYSSGDLKQYAKEYKHEKISQFTNQIQNQMLNYNNKYNINYNINQNINQNFTPNKIQNANPIYQNMSSFNQKNFDPNNIYDQPITTKFKYNNIRSRLITNFPLHLMILEISLLILI